MSIVLCVWRRSWKRSPLGEELREVDHPAAPVLGRPEITAGMHIFMHHNELRVYLVDPPPAEPFRPRAQRSRAHPTHFTPPYPCGNSHDRHQTLLLQQPLPHRENRTEVDGDAHADRPLLAGTALSDPGRGRRRDQSLRPV
jgi:hypothetical protein